MRDLLILAIHLLVTFAKLLRRGGVRAIVAESLVLKHQLLISNRSLHGAPDLLTRDRVMLALTVLFVSPRRIPKLGALIKLATLRKFHKALVDREYRLLFSSRCRRCKPGPTRTKQNQRKTFSHSLGRIETPLIGHDLTS